MRKVMSIIKVEISVPEAVTALKQFKENRLKAFEQLHQELKLAVSSHFENLLQTEMELFLGQQDQLSNKRNGYKERSYTLKGVGTLKIRMPQARQQGFESELLPKHERMDPRLKEDIAILNLAGLSTRTLSMLSNRLLNVDVSKDTVSESLDVISEKACQWLRRPLTDEYWALYIDGTNFNLQRRGTTESEPSLVVLGINISGYRSILAIEPGYKDQSECWRTVFKDLKLRGLNSAKVRIGIMDGLPGLESVFREEFPHAVTQRCWVHSLKNALNKCAKRYRVAFKNLADKVMYANSLDTARVEFNKLKEAMGSDCKRAVACLEKDLESLLTYYVFEKSFWRTLRTTNPIERVNKEFKRRLKVMESAGEQTLEVMVAFVALKLEMNWRKNPVNAKHFEQLKHLKPNVIEEVAEELFD